GGGGWTALRRWLASDRALRAGRAQEAASPLVGPQECLDPVAQGGVAGARPVQVRLPFVGRPTVQGGREHGHQALFGVVPIGPLGVYLQCPIRGESAPTFFGNLCRRPGQPGSRASASQARANAQSRSADRGGSPRAAADSCKVRPAKNFSFTSSAAWG